MRRVFAALVFALACGAAVAAETPLGVIVMHGKWGAPDRQVDVLARALEKAGYRVSVPEMPWSQRRAYDRPVESADTEIDAELEKLKASGAARIVVAGHSLGASYALHYAGRRDVDGVCPLAKSRRCAKGF